MTPIEDKRLFLLDAYALIYRAFFALSKNGRPNSKGEDTSAVMGFVNTLLELLKTERPSHIAVVFDPPTPTFRHQMYTEYKAQRDKTPEPILFAIPFIKEILKAFQIPQIVVEGFEADDVIGTLAKKAEKEGFKVFMVTPDKDFGQLVSDNIFIYRLSRMGNGIEIWDKARVLERFGIQEVDQVRDYLGMMGDSADNIPGLPGVGEKTAKKFIAQYGSMENLLAHAEEIPGALGEKIRENAAMGIFSKNLATICCDAPIEFNDREFHNDPPNLEEVRRIFERLEFRRLTETVYRLYGKPLNPTPEAATPAEKPAPANPDQGGQVEDSPQLDLFSTGSGTDRAVTQISYSYYNTLENSPHTYFSANTPQERERLIEELSRQKEFAFDTESTSLKPVDADIVGMSFSWKKGSGWWVPLPSERDEAQRILDEFKAVFAREDISKVGHNMKYDMEILSNYGIRVKGKKFDTIIAHYLIDPEMRHGMDILSEQFLGYSPMPYDVLTEKKGSFQKTLRQVDPERLKEYAVEDADITLRLKGVFEPMLRDKNARELFEKLEMPLVEVLAGMEKEGIRLDTEFLKTVSAEIDQDLKKSEETIYEQAEEKFNLNSPKKLGEILFDKLHLIDKPKKTKTGQYATSEDVLSSLAHHHRIVGDILEYRSLQKLKSTYVDTLPKDISPRTGRIHTSFNQTVTATGRLSSNDPNLQNIPVRTLRGREIRKAFIPRDENYLILAADYSQIELRIIAAMSHEPTMIQAFANGEDIHASTAAKVFKVPLQQVTKQQRSYAKTVNFGIVYGVSAFGLSQQTDLSRAEAAELIENYYKTYPRLRDYIEEQKEFARQHGYVETIMGRRRYLPEIRSRNNNLKAGAERNAVNAPMQGSAADIIKKAMIDIFNYIEQNDLKTRMLLQVHDELVFDVPKTELDRVKPRIRELMEGAWVSDVPLKVDIGVGNNWLEAH